MTVETCQVKMKSPQKLFVWLKEILSYNSSRQNEPNHTKMSMLVSTRHEEERTWVCKQTSAYWQTMRPRSFSSDELTQNMKHIMWFSLEMNIFSIFSILYIQNSYMKPEDEVWQSKGHVWFPTHLQSFDRCLYESVTPVPQVFQIWRETRFYIHQPLSSQSYTYFTWRNYAHM